MKTTLDFKFRARRAYRFGRGLLRLVVDELYDLSRYLRFSPLGGRPREATHYDAYVTMDYHRLEKGLALRYSRPGFGHAVIENLVLMLRRYRSSFGGRASS